MSSRCERHVTHEFELETPSLHKRRQDERSVLERELCAPWQLPSRLHAFTRRARDSPTRMICGSPLWDLPFAQHALRRANMTGMSAIDRSVVVTGVCAVLRMT
ncbi:hypothetical protein MRB53_039833 [Persea americana]|nr:hypothetical protein MRB53_039833 [Persea americana]